MLNKLEKYFYIFMTYAFMGWVYEVIWFLVMRNKFVNRGFLFGPYLPIYGFGGLILYFILWNFMKKKHKLFNININPLLVIIIIFVVTTVVEYIGHYILDTYFGIILWDYSKDYLNINGRVCFAASRNFAIGGTVALYLIQPIIEKVTSVCSKYKVYHFITILLGLTILCDFILTILK